MPIVQEVMEGFNCTIFAYGQTGTGKTYTMEGGPRRSDDGKVLSAEAGVIPRSIKQIFDTIEANNTDSTVKVTFLELYNEELTDLLSTFDDGKEDGKRLRLLEDRSGVVVQGLEEVVVKSAAEIYQVRVQPLLWLLQREGMKRKRTGRSTLQNANSPSRWQDWCHSKHGGTPAVFSASQRHMLWPAMPCAGAGPRHGQAPHRRDAAKQTLQPQPLGVLHHHPHA